MPDPLDIRAVVLAAGASRRFGSDKLLHPLNKDGAIMPLAAHSLLPWLEIFAQLTVVVRPDADAFCSRIETALGANNAAKINWVVCESAAQGMAESLGAGVRANSDAAGWLIGLADMPCVPACAIGSVKHALLEGAHLAAPSHDGRRGHPVGFASVYRDELIALKGDVGARHLLMRDAVADVMVDDAGIFSDIDMPGDLQFL